MAKLYITDERMLKLVDWALQNGVADTEKEFFEMINFQRTNIGNVRRGLQGFTKEHIRNACEITGASADYIFGFTSVMKRKIAKKPIDILKEAVAAVETEMKRPVRRSIG